MGEQQDVTVLLNGTQHHATLVNGFVHVGRRKVTYGTSVSNTGKSIQETIWQELDDVMDLMMEYRQQHGGSPMWETIGMADPDRIAQVFQEFGKWQGIAEALCLVICLFENPHHPDIESVKGEAVLRWRRRQEMPPTLTDINDEAPDVTTDDGGDSPSN